MSGGGVGVEKGVAGWRDLKGRLGAAIDGRGSNRVRSLRHAGSALDHPTHLLLMMVDAR